MMKVLYAAYKHDPRNPELSSGADYNFYTAIKRLGAEVQITLPSLGRSHFIERFLKRVHRRFLAQRYAKFPLTKVLRASRNLNAVAKVWRPDIIFTIFPPSLVYYKGEAPCIFRLDTTFWGWQQEYSEFSRLGLYLSMEQERRAFARAAKLITHSEWTKDILITKYGVNSNRIIVFANPARLPDEEIAKWQATIRPRQKLSLPLNLLFVGKDYKRKGLSTALKVVDELNKSGTAARLTVCGGPVLEPAEYVSYVGYFKKSDPQQFEQYLDLFRKAHLLLHPALFDPSPIVTSEAAAFGVPTITNDNGGLATSVKDGISGIVLKRHSVAEAYVQAIKDLTANPERYYSLRTSTRRRYETELNWISAGNKLAQITEEVIACHA